MHGGSSTLLDLRVAFGEGWGNAFAGMVLGDPSIAIRSNGVQTDFSIDLEADET